MTYTRDELGAAIAAFVPHWQGRVMEMVEALPHAIIRAWVDQAPQDRRAEVMREAWIDLHVRHGKFQFAGDEGDERGHV